MENEEIDAYVATRPVCGCHEGRVHTTQLPAAVTSGRRRLRAASFTPADPVPLLFLGSRGACAATRERVAPFARVNRRR